MIPRLENARGQAGFSQDRRYRYSLTRKWGDGEPDRHCMFIGLNPSTADDRDNDPTIRRCMTFAHDWGYNGIVMVNLFGLRSTDPEVLKTHDDPVGPDNDVWLGVFSKKAALVVAAWGNGGDLMCRSTEVSRMFPELHCLGYTKSGNPRHPLYIKKTQRPILCPDEPINEARQDLERARAHFKETRLKMDKLVEDAAVQTREAELEVRKLEAWVKELRYQTKEELADECIDVD